MIESGAGGGEPCAPFALWDQTKSAAAEKTTAASDLVKILWDRML
jgi:hypothetical protein